MMQLSTTLKDLKFKLSLQLGHSVHHRAWSKTHVVLR